MPHRALDIQKQTLKMWSQMMLNEVSCVMVSSASLKVLYVSKVFQGRIGFRLHVLARIAPTGSSSKCSWIDRGIGTGLPVQYGIDPNALDIAQDDQDSVEVPETNIPLSDESFQTLSSTVDPLRVSDVYGVDLYLETVSLLHSLMRRDGLVN